MPLRKRRGYLATRFSSSLVMLVMSGSRFPSSATGAAGRAPSAAATSSEILSCKANKSAISESCLVESKVALFPTSQART